jgi:hypothetical protein
MAAARVRQALRSQVTVARTDIGTSTVRRLRSNGFSSTGRAGAAARCGTLAGPRASRCGRFVVYLPADPPSAAVDPPSASMEATSASMEATSASTATLGRLQLSGQLLLGLLLWRSVCDE